jgi:drug/metabolite transporter (DMT)-like permease
VILVGFSWLRGKLLFVPRHHWERLAIVVLSFGAFNILVASAQLSASTSRSAIVTFTMPIWATVLAYFALGEPFDRRRVTGLVLGAAGLTSLGSPLILAGELSLGILSELLAGVSWATGTTLLKRFPINPSPLVITTWQVLLSAFCVVRRPSREGKYRVLTVSSRRSPEIAARSAGCCAARQRLIVGVRPAGRPSR